MALPSPSAPPTLPLPDPEQPSLVCMVIERSGSFLGVPGSRGMARGNQSFRSSEPAACHRRKPSSWGLLLAIAVPAVGADPVTWVQRCSNTGDFYAKTPENGGYVAPLAPNYPTATIWSGDGMWQMRPTPGKANADGTPQCKIIYKVGEVISELLSYDLVRHTQWCR
jgi:hypothetical protein